MKSDLNNANAKTNTDNNNMLSDANANPVPRGLNRQGEDQGEDQDESIYEDIEQELEQNTAQHAEPQPASAQPEVSSEIEDSYEEEYSEEDEEPSERVEQDEYYHDDDTSALKWWNKYGRKPQLLTTIPTTSALNSETRQALKWLQSP